MWKSRKIFPPLCLKSNLLNQIKHKRLFHAGHCIIIRSVCRDWLPQSVRYPSACTLHSAGEAQSSAAGYQSDTHHERPGLWRKQLSSLFREVYRHFGERDTTYAKTTNRLYTSTPGYTAVWSRVNVYSILMHSFYGR